MDQKIEQHLLFLRSKCLEDKEYLLKPEHCKIIKSTIDDSIIEVTNPNLFVALNHSTVNEAKSLWICDQKETYCVELKQFYPDNISSNEWWEQCIKFFPLLSVSGDSSCKTIEDVKRTTFVFSDWIGVSELIRWTYQRDFFNKDAKILEIGPGYGTYYDFLKREKLSTKNYYALDVVKLFEYEKHIIGNGKDIPLEIGHNFDLIFSWNCFQHLSPQQRRSYWKQAYERLKPEGIFAFFTYIQSPVEIKNCKNSYASFLGQFTEKENFNQMCYELHEIGFKFHELPKQFENYSWLVLKK